mgnify:CR=1 FL=1
MIFGSCPYCDHAFTVGVPDQTPVYWKHDCEGCSKTIWTKVARLDPQSWTVEDFEQVFEIDTDKNTITPRRVKGGT